MSAVLLTEDGSTGHSELPDLEMVRDAAISIYNQYLSDKVNRILNAAVLDVCESDEAMGNRETHTHSPETKIATGRSILFLSRSHLNYYST